MEVFIMCECPVCGSKSSRIDLKWYPEYIRKEFICVKCGRLIKAENWDKRYL